MISKRSWYITIFLCWLIFAFICTTKTYATSPQTKDMKIKQTRQFHQKKVITTIKQKAEQPDTSHPPDFLVEKFELEPKYAILGKPYKIHVWLKEYRQLSKTPWVDAVRENVFAPALLKRFDRVPIKKKWWPNSPEITISYAAEEIVDMKVQQKKRVTLTFDVKNDIAEKNEANNVVTFNFGLYPANTQMADLIFYDHPIKHLASESNYYFKSESPNFQKKVNQNVKIWGYIVNFGSAAARPFKVKVKGDDNRDMNTKFTKILSINKMIKPNEVFVFHFYHKWSSPGLKVLVFELDIDDTVIESNENNNISVGTCTLRIAQ